MVLFPCGLEIKEFFGIAFVSKQIFEVPFHPDNAFVFGYHFLEVTSALRWSPDLQVLRQRFKDFAKSN